MTPRIPPSALGTALRVVAKPLLGSPLPPTIQRLGVNVLCAVLPTARVAYEASELAGVPTLEVTPPQARPGATILYFHGGGYMTGSPRGHRALMSHLAVAAQAKVVGLDYRLAPEHPFPAAHTDAVSAYTALLQEGQDPTQVTLAGDSAGGGLALATAVAAQDNQLATPGRLLLISPWLDLRLSAAGDDRADALLSRGGSDRWAEAFTAGHARTDPRCSPLMAPFTGLPPTLVQYDIAETIAGQSVEFIAQARAAGVSVEAQPFSGLWHDFQLFTQLPQARAALTMAGAFIRSES
jgi:monoterpene epsilon-lactone hydrolase